MNLFQFKNNLLLTWLGIILIVILLIGSWILYFLTMPIKSSVIKQASPLEKEINISEERVEIKANESREISFQQSSIIIPKESLKQDAIVTVKSVKPPKLESKDLIYASEVYELGPNVTFEKSVTITLEYDPSKLSDKSMEDYLYIAVWENNQWNPISNGIINKADHTVTAVIEHFSLYTILCDIGKTIAETVIESKTYEELPSEIQVDVGYSKSDIVYIQRAQVPLIGKVSSFIITGASLVSKVSNIFIGGSLGKKELQESIMETTGQEIVKSQGIAGEIAVGIYKTGEWVSIGNELFKIAKGAKEAAYLSPPVVIAKAASWILDVEMDYINSKVEEPWKLLWQLNFLGIKRLELYLIYIHAPYKDGFDTRGIKYYYFDEKNQKYQKFYETLVSVKTEFKEEANNQTNAEIQSPTQEVMKFIPEPFKEQAGIMSSQIVLEKPPFDYPNARNVKKWAVQKHPTSDGYWQLIIICRGNNCQEPSDVSTFQIADWYKNEAVKSGWIVNEERMANELAQIINKDKMFFIDWIIVSGELVQKEGIDEDDLVVFIYWGKLPKELEGLI